ncbi:hypothetical protein ES703_20683 [subsurface metagenome]
MFWQRETLRSGVSMALGQTYELDLPKTGMLGSLVLYLASSPTSDAFVSLPKWRLIDYISKIEIIADGSEVIKSFDGVEALAAAFYDDGRVPVGMWRTYSTTPQRQWIPIHFGRFLQDELYGLDLSKFNQVTLKITNDGAAAQWGADITANIFGYFLREGGGFGAGYFREEVWKSYLPVAGEIEYHDLPVAYPIRRILLEARPGRNTDDAKNTDTMRDLMREIDFTFHSGQVRVYHDTLEHLGHLTVLEGYGEVETRGSVHRTQGHGFEVGVGYCTNNLGYGAADADGRSNPLANMSKDVQESAQESAYNPATGPLAWVVKGHAFGHCTPLWIARKEDLSDMLDAAALAVVKVDILCRSTATITGTDRNARNAIILSRLVR